MRVRDLLLAELGSKASRCIPSSFDIVGSREGAVAIVEVPPGCEMFKEKIGEGIMRIHRNVRAVYAKTSVRKGVYRIREYELIAGEDVGEVIHKEGGVRMKLDIRKVYFSPRESTERLRIARQVRPGETVMVMFAGVGPYALVIAKHQPLVSKVIAIEINPVAYEYMVENIRLNHLEGKIVPVLGDVKDKAGEWYGLCDRVVMPLPKGAHHYLAQAFNCLKRRGFIHFYHWAPEDDLFTEAYMLLERAATLWGRNIRILDMRRVLPYAPRIYKTCIDAVVTLYGSA